jgi:exosortase J
LAGCLGLLNSLLTLWTIWTTDPLRSIGMLIPPASILLTLRVWRQMGWQMRGSLWGLLLVALAYLLNFSRQSLVLTGSLSTVAFFSFNPVALPLFLYASGLALLFAGPAVCRKAWFPLGLLLLAQPVPNISTQFVDLPLQHLSAEVARAFATLIGFAPNTPQLRLMFSPTFGMFIAPGCDGIRGAVAMGYIALLLGYLKRVSWPRWAAYVFGAVLLGYLFNFTRLCLLVLYYRLALGHPAMESVAKQADYGIGSCLFLFAAFLFLRLVYRRQDERPAEAVFSPTPTPHAARLLAACAGLLALTAMALALPGARPGSLHRNTLPTATLLSRLPYRVGPYDLTRSWYEQQNGTVVLIAGAYSAPGTDEVTLGVWVAPNSSIHDVNYCYLARGQEPTSSSVQTYSTGSGGSASFNMSRYSDGITDSLVASAFCTPGSCSDLLQTTSKDKLGVSFVLPHLNDLSHVNGRVSFMIRVEEPHGADAPQVIDRRLTQEIAHYIAGLKINALSAAFQ